MARSFLGWSRFFIAILQSKTMKTKTYLPTPFQKENLILGLDIGLTSIAWALIDQTAKMIIDGGLLYFHDTDKTTNADRQIAKNRRKQHRRKKMRRKAIQKILYAHHMFPIPPTQRKKVLRYWDQSKQQREEKTADAHEYHTFRSMIPWILRQKAIEGQKLTLMEIGRVCYHFAHQRGFNEKMLRLEEEKAAKVLKQGKPDEDKIGAEDTEEAIKEHLYPFLGHYLASLYPTHRAPYQSKERIRNRHTYRNMYTAEFDHIWQTQKKYYPEQLTHTLYKTLHHHLFFQLPLQQPPKGRCRLEPNKPHALKASLLFQKFQLHKFLNNLRINGETLKPNTEIRETITKFYHQKARLAKPKFTIEELKKHLSKKYPSEKHYLNYNPKEIIKPASLTSQLIDIFGQAWHDLSEKQQIDRWHIIIDNHKENPDFLQTYAKDKWNLPHKALEKIAKINVPAGVAKFSEKALQYTIPYLEQGFTEDKALLLGSIKKAFGHHFGTEENPQKPNYWKTLSLQDQQNIEDACIDIIRNHESGHFEKIKAYLQKHYPDQAYAPHKIYYHTNRYDVQPKNTLGRPTPTRNPQVNKALHALRPTINAILQQYDLPYIPRIHVEMARELKKSEEERKKIANQQKKQQQANDLIYAELKKLGVNTNNKDNFTKYALWIESSQKCVYSGKTINIKELFQKNSYEIEHIIPRNPKDSRMENLTLCHIKWNQKKGGRTPYQAFGNTHKWEEMVAYAHKYLPYRKYQRFISQKDPKETYEMTQKDINLTAYIAKEVASYLRQVSPTVHFTKGAITAILREQWDLDTLLAPPILMPEKSTFHDTFTSKDPTPAYTPGKYYIALTAHNKVIGYISYNPELPGRTSKEIQEDLKEAHQEKKIVTQAKKNTKDKPTQASLDKEVKKLDAHIKDLYKELAEAQKNMEEQRKSIYKSGSETQVGSFPETIKSMLKEKYPQKEDRPNFHILAGEIHTEDMHGHPIPPTFYQDEAKNRTDHRHHIIDALVIAATRHIHTQSYNKKSSTGAKYDTLKETTIKPPWSHFRNDTSDLLDQLIIYRRPKKIPFEKNVTKKVKVPNYPDPLTTQPQKKYRWIDAQGDSARGKLHDETYYGKYETQEGHITYHHRKKIEEIKTEKQVKKIVDKQIREKVQELIQKSGGKITKDTFYHVEKDGKTIIQRIPKLYLSNKRENGQPVPIKKVRFKEKSSKSMQLSPMYNRWIEPSGNYIAGIYQKQDGTWVDYIYNLKEALPLLKNNGPSSLPPSFLTAKTKKKSSQDELNEQAQLVLKLQRDDLVILNPPSLLQEDHTFPLNHLNKTQLTTISQATYRLQKLSQAINEATGERKSGNYVFRKHIAATLDNPLQKIQVAPSSLQKLYPIKIILDPLGKICELIDPIRQRTWSIE